MHDVAVGHDVLLALHAQLTRRARGRLRAERVVVGVRDHLGLDESALEVAVDHACRLRGLGTDAHRPGPRLLGTRGEEALQAEQAVCLADERVQSRLRQTLHLEVLGKLGGVEFGHLGLDLRADRHGGDAVDLGKRGADLALVHVGNVQHGLHREEVQVTDGGAVLVGHVHRPGAVTLAEPRLQPSGNLETPGRERVSLCVLLHARQRAFERAEVGQHELGLDGLHVTRRVDTTVHVNDVGIGEVPHDLGDRVALADVGKELVAEALAFVRALHQPCDVHELDGGGNHPFGGDEFGQAIEARVGHGHDADVGLDRGERVVGGVNLPARERGEERGLADVGQTDDADGK